MGGSSGGTRLRRLLSIAEWCCGDAARHSIFEPLAADWQRELAERIGHHSVVDSCPRRLGVRGNDGGLSGNWRECDATRDVGEATDRLLLSTVVLIAIQIGLNASVISNDFPFEMRIWMALPMILPLAIPLAMLPLMMLLRGPGQIGSGGAATMICAATLLTYVTTGWVTPQMQGDVRDALYEQLYRRDVANDQAGRVTSFPATAARQARPTTPEQRAAQRERWRNNPQYTSRRRRNGRVRAGAAHVPDRRTGSGDGGLRMGARRTASERRAPRGSMVGAGVDHR